MLTRKRFFYAFRPIALFLFVACAGEPQQESPETLGTVSEDTLVPAAAESDTVQRLAVTEGFSGPEAVRYDPEQDIYFVSNFNGEGSAKDNNGFISRMRPDGSIDQLRFIAGGENGIVLHAPRGMYIVGDTLWVADADAVRGFDKRSGAAVASIDFSDRETGFLNDVAVDPGGTLYVTDTGTNTVYRVRGSDISVALADSALGRPNGITWDPENDRMIVVPYGGDNHLFGWDPDGAEFETIGTSPGGRFDGVEVLPDGRMVVASQADSSIHLFSGDTGRQLFQVEGRPADIGLDTQRYQVAIPYIDLNRVEVWQLPRR